MPAAIAANPATMMLKIPIRRISPTSMFRDEPAGIKVRFVSLITRQASQRRALLRPELARLN
jgi:hypothetical protein